FRRVAARSSEGFGSQSEKPFVKQVAEQQHSQSSEIEKSKAVLFQLQLQELEKEMKSILLETKTTEREIHQQDDAIEMAKHHCENLEAQVRALYSENIKLRFDAETVQEELEMTFVRNNEYREKIKAHKHLFWEVESKMPVMIELAKKQAVVEELRAKKEELMHDLQNPEGTVFKQVQEEITFFKREITEVKELINKKTNLLEEEKLLHANLANGTNQLAEGSVCEWLSKAAKFWKIQEVLIKYLSEEKWVPQFSFSKKHQ
uniref:Coiled-coil domain containing 122 n=1 Tax=Nothoprocta perdicaria TaxID=30464 RepID=A0A8C6Z645_NOTPE